MLRAQLTHFIDDPDQNVLEFKIEQVKTDKITLSILGEHKFNIDLLGRNEYSVSTQDPHLSNEWLNSVRSFCDQKQNKVTISDLLDECTRAFADLPDEDELDEDKNQDEDEDGHTEDEDDGEIPDIELTPMSDLPETGYDPFETALMSSTDLAKIEERQRIQYEHQQKQISKNEKTWQISDIIEKMKTSEMKDYSGEADKTLKCVFYLDGFTIDDGPLLSLEDPMNKKIIDSFKQGFVPPEYSQNSAEVDVHVIWEECTFEQKKQQNVQQEVDEVEDLYFQQQLAQIAEMERLQQMEKNSTQQGEQGRIPESPQQAKQVTKPTISTRQESTTTDSPITTKANTPLTTHPTNTSDDPTIFVRKNGQFTYQATEDREITSIQFRAEAERIVGQFNLDDPLSVIIDFVAYHPKCPYSKFRVVQMFPRKNMEYSQQTLREAGLKNAALMIQRVD